MKAIYTNRKNMARSFRSKAVVAPAVFRAVNGRNVSLVAAARKRIMESKLYRRSGNPNLTRRLINSEQIRFKGLTGEISNTAPYAQHRNDETGTSEAYGHDKELHFAEGGVAETRAERSRNVREGMRQIMRVGS